MDESGSDLLDESGSVERCSVQGFCSAGFRADLLASSSLRHRAAWSGLPVASAELHEAFEGLGQAVMRRRRDRRLAPLHPSARDQQRLALGVLLLGPGGAAERGPDVGGRPQVRLSLLADGQAFAEDRLGLGIGLDLEQPLAGVGGAYSRTAGCPSARYRGVGHDLLGQLHGLGRPARLGVGIEEFDCRSSEGAGTCRWRGGPPRGAGSPRRPGRQSL